MSFYELLYDAFASFFYGLMSFGEGGIIFPPPACSLLEGDRNTLHVFIARQERAGRGYALGGLKMRTIHERVAVLPLLDNGNTLQSF